MRATRLHPHWFGVCQGLENAIRRGLVADVARDEEFVAEWGGPEDIAWIELTYDQLGVAAEFRCVDEAALEARTAAKYGDTASVEDVREAARTARREHLSQCRWNAETGAIPPGWKVLPGDPPEAEA